jgi:hypothetical protein
MNCRLARKKISESLASAASEMSSGIHAHCTDCPECRAFYEKERGLYSALESELASLMNPAVPVSLVPGVRARLDEVPTPQSVWVPRLVFASLALAVLIVCVTYLAREPQDQPRVVRVEVASGQDSRPDPAAPLPAKPVVADKFRAEKRRKAQASSDTVPEVIISAEERKDIARFVAHVPEQGNVAVALTLPASTEADAPIEIALLDLGFVEVKPLQPETAE